MAEARHWANKTWAQAWGAIFGNRAANCLGLYTSKRRRRGIVSSEQPQATHKHEHEHKHKRRSTRKEERLSEIGEIIFGNRRECAKRAGAVQKQRGRRLAEATSKRHSRCRGADGRGYGRPQPTETVPQARARRC